MAKMKGKGFWRVQEPLILVAKLLLLVVVHLTLADDPYCSHNEQAVTDTIKSRLVADTSNRLLIFDEAIFQCYGRVKTWIYYSTNNAEWKPGVWRLQSGNYYKLVGENIVPGTTAGYTEYEVPEGERILFQPGDQIGYRHATAALNYDMGLDSVPFHYVGISDYSTVLEPGTVKDVSSTEERSYSLKAVFEDEDFTVDCAQDYYGNEVKNRGTYDGVNYIMILHSQPLTCYGQVKAWSFWAKARNGGFRVGVYRPDSNDDSKYFLLGETDIPSGHALDSVVTHDIESNDEWISFEPGDVIGWRWHSSGTTIARDDSGAEIFHLKYTGHDDNAYNGYGVGDTFTVAGDLHRAYSLQAIFSPKGYRGCFEEDFASRDFGTSIGNFNPDYMTEEMCIRECAAREYSYAAVQEGSLCYCSDTYGTHSVGNNTACDWPCTGNSNFNCGGYFYNKVFSTPPVLIDFVLDQTVLTRTYTEALFGHNLTSGEGVTYAYNYGDGFSSTGLTVMDLTHIYGKPGDYAIKATASDPWLNTQTQTVQISIETEMTDVLVDCPPAVEYDKRFDCTFWVYQGTNMTAHIDFFDGRVVDFDIEDAETLHYGGMVDHDYTLNNQPTSRVYLAMNDVISQDGRLVGWEYNAIATGAIIFQVYRPKCSSQWEKFCYRSFSCIRRREECEEMDTVWGKTCSGSGMFSFTARDCVQDSDGSLEGKHTFDDIPVEFDFVTEFPYTIDAVGRTFIPLDHADHVDVFKGDVIGWYNSNAGKLAYRDIDSAVEGPEFLPSMTSFDSRSSGQYVVATSGATVHNFKHSLKAHIVRPSILHVYHNYTWPENRMNISMTIDSSFSKNVSDIQEIKVQEYIKNVTFIAPTLAVTTEEEVLYVVEHPGTEVTYHWWFGNGDTAITQEMSVNYTWPDDGVYNITLLASNDISSQIYESWIVLQDRITNFEWKDSVPKSPWSAYPITPKEWGTESYINFGMDKGTNLTYEVNIGDGIVPVFFMRFDEDVNITDLIPGRDPPLTNRLMLEHNGLTGSVVSLYETIGYFPVYINASNRVSWSVIESEAVIQIKITNFRIVKPPPMKFGEIQLIGIRYDTGTNLTFTGEFDSLALNLTDPSLYSMSDANGEGYVVIGPELYDDRGFYPLEFTTRNLISGPFTDSVQVRIEFAITDFTMWTSEIYVIPTTSISFSFDMEIGSDLTFTIDYDDGNSVVIEDIEMKRNLNDSYTEWHDYDVAADYNVTIWASSCVSNVTIWTYIKVQNPVDNVTMEVYTPGVIPYMEEGTIRYDYSYTGNQYGPPTDAEVDYTFTRVYKQKLVVGYVEDFPIQESNPVVQNMTLAKFGTYETAVNISNLVSWMLFTATIEMERPILNLVVTCPRPHIRVGKKARLIATTDWGSRITYYWDFADGKEVTVEVGGETDRQHLYTDEGTFYVTVYGSNLLSNVHYTLPDPVKVQYPIRGMEWTGRKLSRLYTNQGYTNVPFDLRLAKEIHFPTEAQYEIDWGDGETASAQDLTQDDADSSRDTDTLYHVMSLNHYYLEWGNYNVTIRMWNLVTDVTLLFDIWIYETVTQLEKEVAYNELIMDGEYSADVNVTEDLIGFGKKKNYFKLEEAIVVKATHASGTDLTYTWDFGDQYYEPPTTSPIPVYNSTTGDYTTLQPPTTTGGVTSMPLNCSILRMDWVAQTFLKLYNDDLESKAIMAESRAPNCSLVYATPPPFNWTAYNISLLADDNSPDIVWCNLTEIEAIEAERLRRESAMNETCPDGWQISNGSCYFLNETEVGYNESSQVCTSMNASLASIHSMAEHQLIAQHVRNVSILIGLSNLDGNGFQWADGTQVNYTNWNSSNALSKRDDPSYCVIVTGDAEWQIELCDSVMAGFVCKMQVELIPAYGIDTNGNATNGNDSVPSLNCTMPLTTREPTTTESTTPESFTVCAPLNPIDLVLQEDLCENAKEYHVVNETIMALANHTYFDVSINETFSMNSFINNVRERVCLMDENILTELINYAWQMNLTDFMEPLVCLEDPPSTAAPPTTTTPPMTSGPTKAPPVTDPPWVVRTKEPRAIWWYNRRGTYTISLNVSNPVYWVMVTKTIVIQRGIFDLELSDHGPRPKNTTIEFELDTGNIGTDVCYFVDFRDVTSEINWLAFWGHRSTCASRYPDHFADSEFLRFTSVSNTYLEGLANSGLSPNLTLTNVFLQQNAYKIRIVAHNMVSEVEIDLKTAVTKGICYYPVLSVREKNQCDQYYPFCDENGYREYFASRDVFVYSTAYLNCTSAKYAMYTWRAFSVDDSDDTETELFDLGGSELSGFTRRELAIKAAVLEYGLYRFELNVSMWGEIGVESLEATYLRVVPTPLVVMISGGSERLVRWNELVPIDGASQTYDPDVVSGDGDGSVDTGIRFEWLCRREHETFSVWNWEYTEMISPGTVNASFVHEKDDYGGCFGRAGYDLSGYGGKISNATGGRFTMDTFYMYEEMTYELMLVVFKGTRRTITYQSLYVATGNPPNMVIGCKTNCKSKLNPTSRMALESTDLDARAGVQLFYKWEIFEIVDDGEKLTYLKLPTSSWLSYSGTGDSMANLAIDANLFADESLYRISVYADRKPDFSNYGKASNDIITNERPLVGNCSVTPGNGTALETEFNVFCVDWSDPDMPLNYRYAKRLKPDESWTWMYSGEKPFMETPSIFPQGYEDEDFQVYLLVRVDDFIGSFSDLELSVTVIAPVLSKDEMTEKLQNLTGEGSVMTELISSGDSAGAANVVAACAGMLNIAASESATTSIATTMAPYTAYTTESGEVVRRRRSITTAAPLDESDLAAIAAAEADAEARTRETMRESMVDAMSLSQPNTVGQMKQVASAFNIATSQTSEMSPNSASNTMATGVKFMGLLQDQANIAGADEVENSGVSILAMVGNAVEGAQKKAKQAKANAEAVASELQALVATTAVPDASYYLNRDARDASSSDYSYEDYYALEAQGAEADAEVAALDAQNRDMSESTQGLVGNLMTTVNSNMVTGQAPINLPSPAMNLSIDKAFTGTMSGKKYGGSDGGSSFKLPSAETLFGSGNGTTPSVDAQVVIEKTNSRTWSNTSSAVKGGTASMTLTNSTGGIISLNDLDEPLEVWLSREEDEVDLSTLQVIYNNTKPSVEPMIVHIIGAPGLSSLHIEAHALNWNGTDADNVTLSIYMRVGKAPTLDIYDFNCTLPHKYDGWEYVNMSADSLPDPHTCFLSNTLLNSYSNGSDIEIYVGVKHTGGINESIAEEFYANSEYGSSFWPVHYVLRPWSSACSYYDAAIEDWVSEGCEVGDLSTLYNTQCYCYSAGGGGGEIIEEEDGTRRRRRRSTSSGEEEAATGATFGGGFKVPMNTLDLSVNAFSMLDENPVVFVFMVCCIAVYLTCLLWARKADQRDKVQAGATPLVDNDPRDHFNYEVTVFTGVRSGSSTTAKVTIILTGDAETSRPRLLLDDKRKIFQSGGIDTFILSCPRSLGNLQHLRVWHDNSGKHPKWFLNRLSIKDLTNDRMYFFMLDKWLAVEEDDGQIERVVPVAGKSELTSFGFLFYSKTRRNLGDGHLWFSVFGRPARSNFTRCQRATCCLSVLFSTMMANIFFFGVDVTSGNAGGAFILGPIEITVGQICVGVISSLMVFPANLLVVQMFRLSRAPPEKIQWKFWKKTKQEKDAQEDKSKEEIESDKKDRMDDKAEDELQQQLSFLEDGDDSRRLLKTRSSKKVSFSEPESDRKMSKDEGFEDEDFDDEGEKKDGEKIEGEDGEFHLVGGIKKTEKKKKGKFMLPWQCFMIGWIAGFGTVGTAFYMTIQIAGQFGKEKATEWLQTMCCSLIQDILFSQPIKVLCLATFYALVIKKPDKEDENPSTPVLKGDEEYIHERLSEEELNDPQKLEELERQKMLCPVKPPDMDDISEAREIRFNEIKMTAVLKEIWLYVAFLLVLFLMGYGNINPDSYYIQQSIRGTFLRAEHNGNIGFDGVSNRVNFWTYINDVFVPSLYTPPLDNGGVDTVNARQRYIADKAHILLGTVRLRQLRVYEDSCKLEEVMEETINHCRDVYSAMDDVELSYDEGWQDYNRTIGINHDSSPFMGVWKYRDWDETDSYPQYGDQYLYYGGGFTVEFGNNLDKDLEMVDYLKRMDWVDQATRAVFLEFAVYNPVSNVHIFIMNLVEFPPTGACMPFVSMRCMTLDHYYGVYAYFVMAAEVVFCLFMLWFMYKEAKNVKRQKKEYIKSISNWFEIITVALAIGAVVGYFYKLFKAMQLMNEINAAPEEFHSFQYLAYWDDIYMSMVGLLMFFATIKFSKLLRFNKKMLLLSHTIYNFAYELSLFMVMFTVVYMAFSSFCFLNFYTLRDYSNFLRTIESLFGTLLGKFDFNELVEADRILGPMFFFFYVLLVMWTLVNMFVAIICDGFSKARTDQEQMKNELEIVDFMVGRFKQWTGFAEKRIKSDAKLHVYLEGVDEKQVECDQMRYKLDEMVSKLNEFVVNTKRDDKELFGDPDEGGKSKQRLIYMG